MPNGQQPVNLRRIPEFRDDGPVDLERVHHPWPKPGDQLIREPLQGENFIYPIDKAWTKNIFAQFSFFANQYRDSASKLVRDWLDTGWQQPENIAYAVAYLYRHAIELEMKAIIARQARFRKKNPEKQKDVIKEHSLHKLWNKVKRFIGRYYEPAELRAMEALLLQLHQLDENSEGFRYPFGFKTENHVTEIVPALGRKIGYASFENMVEKLVALDNWLEMTEEAEQQHRDFEAEQRRDSEQ